MKESRVIKVKRILTVKKIKTIEQLSNIEIKLLDIFFRFVIRKKGENPIKNAKTDAPEKGVSVSEILKF